MLFKPKAENDSMELFGLKFPNKVGLAAGFDKDARYMHSLASLGFGFVEVGTVTPRPQEGNPKPRLFRLVKDKALINRMGFNNRGVEAMVAQLKNRPKHIIIGGNIGKNKTTPNDKAVDDYLICFKALHDLVDYFVVNVSSPNTPGLRELQEKGPLTNILQQLKVADTAYKTPRPILLKIAPDLSESQLEDIVEIAHNTGIEGLIATNTTISRKNLHATEAELESIGNGGLSGAPVQSRATEVVQYLASRSQGRYSVIGVGGISDEKSAKEKLHAGAALIQVYSGFIFEGPGLIKKLVKGIRA
jgi:dihydroorotate dehydrogenase